MNTHSIVHDAFIRLLDENWDTPSIEGVITDAVFLAAVNSSV